MARPAKSINIQSGNITSDTKDARQKTEDKLRGNAENMAPSFELTEKQMEVFNFIKKVYEDVELLGELDCYILTEGAVVIDRLREIEQRINENPMLLFDRDVCNTRKEYMQNFFRVCNELSLSPQSRAKMGIIAAGKDAEKNDPVLKIFNCT